MSTFTVVRSGGDVSFDIHGSGKGEVMKVFEKVGLLILVALLGFSISGCASIVAGGDEKVSIQSDPSEATIKILDADGMTVFNSQTPATAVLKKGNGFFKGANYRIVIEKRGYRKQEVVLTSNLNAGWYLLGNLFIGGLIGWLIVDPMTGAMWSLSPEKISVEMAKEVSWLGQKDGLMIVLLKDVPNDMVKVLEPVKVPD
jgi:hypothetical protein